MNSSPITYIEKIAEGGVANIFLAKSPDVTGQEKYLICKSPKPSCKSEFLDSIEREIYFAERIQHPNILDIFERRSVQGDDCLVMEYMDGHNFQKLLQICISSGQRVPYHLAIYAIGQAALGLHAAHEMVDEFGNRLDTVHCDISPENILFSMDGDIKISDFGIALTNKMPDPTEIHGKFNYMSPEQAWGDRPDRRSDIFSLATVLYEAVTGCRFNPNDDPNVAIQNAQFGLFTPPHELVEDFPADLEQILLKSLDLDKKLRFNTAFDFKEAIDSCASKYQWYTDKNIWLDYLQQLFGTPNSLLPRMKREHYPKVNVQIPNQYFDATSSQNSNPQTESLFQKFAVQRENMNPEEIDRTEALPAPSLEMLKALENEMENKGSVLDDVFNTIDAEKFLAKMQKEKPKESALDDIFNSIDAEKARENNQVSSQSQPINNESSFNRKESSFDRKESSFDRKESSFDRKESSFDRKESSFDRKESSFDRKESSFTKKESSFTKKESSFTKKESSFNEHLKSRRVSGPKVFQPSMAVHAVPTSSSMATSISIKPQDSASIALEEFLRMEEESNRAKENAASAMQFPQANQETAERTEDSASVALEDYLKMEQKSSRKPQDSASIALEEYLKLEQESSRKPQDSASIALEEYLKLERESIQKPRRDSASAAFDEFLRMEQETNKPAQDSASAAFDEFLRLEQETNKPAQDPASAAFDEFLRLEQETNKPAQDPASAAFDEFLRMEQQSETRPALSQFIDDANPYDNNADPYADNAGQYVNESEQYPDESEQYQDESEQFADDLSQYADDGYDEEDESCKTDVLASPFDANGNLILGEFPLPPYNDFETSMNAPGSTTVLKLDNDITSSNPIVQPNAQQTANGLMSTSNPIIHDEPTVSENGYGNPLQQSVISNDSTLSPVLNDDQPTTKGQAFTDNMLNLNQSRSVRLNQSGFVSADQPGIVSSNNSAMPVPYDPDFEEAQTISGTKFKSKQKKLKKESGVGAATIILIILAIVAVLTAFWLIYYFYFM
ncbi:MAG: protein kinase [Proteobacteria bacterium]|nr:protein kinase [Pseudomonadota bacterium]